MWMVSEILVQVENLQKLSVKRLAEAVVTIACQELIDCLPCHSIEILKNSCLDRLCPRRYLSQY